MSGMRFFAGWFFGLRKSFSATTQAEREALYRHVKDKITVVEIGVYHGVNTARFLDLIAPEGIIYAVDPFFKGRLGFSTVKSIAHKEVLDCHNQVRWIEELGCNAASIFANLSNRPVDFIFIDGDHSWNGISGDWAAWRPLFAVGCIIALHDSAVSSCQTADATTGSVRFTREIIHKDLELEIVEIVDSLTIYRRKLPTK